MILRLPAPLRVFKLAFIDFWDSWLLLLIVNLGWMACTLTIILAPPALFALYAAANEIAHGRLVNIGEFAHTVRRYFWQSWRWAFVNILIVLLAWYGLFFYGKLGTEIGLLLQFLLLLVFAGWLTVQFYALPYLMEQEDKRLIAAWRNALFTLLASALYTAVIMIFAAIIAILNIRLVLPLFIGGATLFALLGTRAVLERLDTFQKQKQVAASIPSRK